MGALEQIRPFGCPSPQNGDRRAGRFNRCWPLLLILTACASASVNREVSDVGDERLARPDRVLVYDFAVSPAEVKLDGGVMSGRAAGLVDGATSRTEEELAVGRRVADRLAERLVADIRELGLPAERAYGDPPEDGDSLLIKGQFLSIDEGNRAERVVIGLGAGRTEVVAEVQVYHHTADGDREIEHLRAEAHSGRKPGMAEMMGIGALAGRLLTATAVSAGVSAGSEMMGASVEDDAQRIADKITDELKPFFVGQGWINAGGRG
jgi:hypothetical protein